MTDQEKYEAFITAVFDGVEFDENAVNHKDLQRSAERFEELRKCWVAGEPYEPSAILQDLVFVFYKTHAKVHSSDLCLEVERALELLSQFCLDKSRAHHRRSKGLIEAASHWEQTAERAYNQLPKAWRW